MSDGACSGGVTRQPHIGDKDRLSFWDCGADAGSDVEWSNGAMCNLERKRNGEGEPMLASIVQALAAFFQRMVNAIRSRSTAATKLAVEEAILSLAKPVEPSVRRRFDNPIFHNHAGVRKADNTAEKLNNSIVIEDRRHEWQGATKSLPCIKRHLVTTRAFVHGFAVDLRFAHVCSWTTLAVHIQQDACRPAVEISLWYGLLATDCKQVTTGRCCSVLRPL